MLTRLRVEAISRKDPHPARCLAGLLPGPAPACVLGFAVAGPLPTRTRPPRPQDKLEFSTETCSATYTGGIPGWNMRQDLDGTSWHSVWHISTVMVPDMQALLAKEEAKPVEQRSASTANKLRQGCVGWGGGVGRQPA